MLKKEMNARHEIKVLITKYKQIFKQNIKADRSEKQKLAKEQKLKKAYEKYKKRSKSIQQPTNNQRKQHQYQYLNNGEYIKQQMIQAITNQQVTTQDKEEEKQLKSKTTLSEVKYVSLASDNSAINTKVLSIKANLFKLNVLTQNNKQILGRQLNELDIAQADNEHKENIQLSLPLDSIILSYFNNEITRQRGIKSNLCGLNEIKDPDKKSKNPLSLFDTVNIKQIRSV